MKRILFVYEYLGLGGVEAILSTRMKHLARLGYAVRAMFFQNKGGRSLFADLPDEDIGLPLTPLEKNDFLTQFAPDLIVTMDTPSIIEIAHTALPKVPVLYEVHTTYERESRFLKSKSFLQQIRMIVVPSEAQKRFVQKLLAVPQTAIRIVPNALDERFVSPLPTHQWQGEHSVVTWVGRLDEVKNWRAYLEIAARVAGKTNDVSFRLIGGLYSELENQDALWALIQKNHLESRFHWYPAIAPEQMPGLLDDVQLSGGCIISTSRTESFGMSVLEAMSRACAVVVPEGGALAELAQNNVRGLTYKLTDYDQAAECILRLLQTPDLRQSLGQQARAHALSFDGASTTGMFLDAIQALE